MNIDKIIVNKDRTKATIYYLNRSPVNVYSDIGQVLPLIDFLLAPIGYNSYIDCKNALNRSLDNTTEIDLNKKETKMRRIKLITLLTVLALIVIVF